MAYTRIHAIKSTVAKAVAYICNPDKTDQQLLVGTFGCTAETARHDFDYALSRTKSSDKNQAYHLIQSFARDEVSHEEAHRIGIELADKLLGGKYSYVVATHTDKEHPHNHIIFCAADNIEHKKYNACKKSYCHIRQLSDELCKEHNLSIIEPRGRKGKKYVEWKAEQEGTSWKKRLQEDIDESIRISKSYEEFLHLIREKGYTVSGEKIGDPRAKYIKFTAGASAILEQDIQKKKSRTGLKIPRSGRTSSSLSMKRLAQMHPSRNLILRYPKRISSHAPVRAERS